MVKNIKTMNKVVKTLKPQQDPAVRTRLIWMRENTPHTLIEQWEDGTLRENVLNKIIQAEKTKMRMIEQGMNEMEAEEIFLHVLAPADGMPARTKIKESIFRKIVAEVMS